MRNKFYIIVKKILLSVELSLYEILFHVVAFYFEI